MKIIKIIAGIPGSEQFLFFGIKASLYEDKSKLYRW